jgi:hypothetical protein
MTKLPGHPARINRHLGHLHWLMIERVSNFLRTLFACRRDYLNKGKRSVMLRLSRKS